VEVDVDVGVGTTHEPVTAVNVPVVVKYPDQFDEL